MYSPTPLAAAPTLNARISMLIPSTLFGSTRPRQRAGRRHLGGRRARPGGGTARPGGPGRPPSGRGEPGASAGDGRDRGPAGVGAGRASARGVVVRVVVGDSP